MDSKLPVECRVVYVVCISTYQVIEYSVIRVWRLRASELVVMHIGSNVHKVKLEKGTELY